MKEDYIPYENKKLFYRDIGAGPAVLLLHGFPFDGRLWLPFAKKLSGQLRLIIPDLPGFGKSERPEKQLDMHLMGEAVVALAEQLNLGQCAIIGHSMGGYIALAMASQNMLSNLKGMVLFHSQAAADDEAARTKRNENIRLINNDMPTFVNGFVPGLYGKTKPASADEHLAIALSQNPGTVASAMAGLRDRQSHLYWLTEASTPLLFILGKEDSRMPATNILAQAALTPHAEVLLLNNVGHMGFAEAPDIVAPVIRDFCLRCLGQ